MHRWFDFERSRIKKKALAWGALSIINVNVLTSLTGTITQLSSYELINAARLSSLYTFVRLYPFIIIYIYCNCRRAPGNFFHSTNFVWAYRYGFWSILFSKVCFVSMKIAFFHFYIIVVTSMSLVVFFTPLKGKYYNG